MRRALRIAGQVLVYGVVALVIGIFSTWPVYRQLEPDQALLRLSFSHPGKIKQDCRERTPEELARLPANMRSALDCPRERSAVVVRLELDGRELLHESFAPSGLSHDGASTGYRRVPVGAGTHRIRAQFRDDVRTSRFTYQAERELVLAPGQVVLIDFAPERGGVIIR